MHNPLLMINMNHDICYNATTMQQLTKLTSKSSKKLPSMRCIDPRLLQCITTVKVHSSSHWWVCTHKENLSWYVDLCSDDTVCVFSNDCGTCTKTQSWSLTWSVVSSPSTTALRATSRRNRWSRTLASVSVLVATSSARRPTQTNSCMYCKIENFNSKLYLFIYSEQIPPPEPP